MSFTEDKFIKLSSDERIKKTIFALNDFLETKKPLSYFNDIFGWLNKYSGREFIFPENKESLLMLKSKLLEILKLENPFCEENPIDDNQRTRITLPLVIVLEDIRSPYNVGSIIRSSECFGVEEIHLAGYTPSPSANDKVSRTSRGVDIKIIEHENIESAIKALRSKNYRIYSLEKCKGSQDIKTIGTDSPFALILGNEEFGVSKKALSFSDEIFHIELLGRKNSLNVSNAASAALYEISSKHKTYSGAANES